MNIDRNICSLISINTNDLKYPRKDKFDSIIQREKLPWNMNNEVSFDLCS